MSIVFAVLLAVSCGHARVPAAESTQAAPPVAKGQAEAVFAGGCFWCTESDFEKVPGVISVESGYTGGTMQGPTYEQVSSGGTGMAESVRVVYDPTKVGYGELLTYFWHHIDPTQAEGQFCDHGHQYRSAVFTSDPQEAKLAEQTRAEVQAELGKPVLTTIEPRSIFWLAEEYHQDFYEKNPTRYHSYRQGCGRDQRVAELWGKANP